ncbi:DUF421 domain-containing protein [Paenibacillus sp. N1-5-1-14]|uniref:DUF421 domain-containing protein n=1 Tax=Paenibacillus radicibacter TaxID=2972488 RepID=UPI00215970D2|nr:DUF421 domain-containing protein [Paenibacillus radicibacter]MCR8642636.1 DUF421 domain-containing protein [Paenibacillus radicibacter]
MPDVLEICIRTVLAVVVLFLLTKLLGKRQVTQLSLFEYITGITIGNLAGSISLDVDTDWYLGVVALLLWAVVSLGIEFIQMKSKKIRDFIDSTGTVLIRSGKILENNLRKEKLTVDELMAQLRKKRAFHLADVEFAIIEPSGDLNVLLTRENQPLTPKDIGLYVEPEEVPQIIIMDGKLQDKGLIASGFTREWLNQHLQQLDMKIEEILVGQVHSNGKMYIDAYNDNIEAAKLAKPLIQAQGSSSQSTKSAEATPLVKPSDPPQKAALLAALKKCEAEMLLFGLTTKSPEAQAMLGQCSQQLEDMIAQIKPVQLQ